MMPANKTPDESEWRLGEQDVCVWTVSVDSAAVHLQQFGCILSREEQWKASRFHFLVDQARFIVAHGVLRTLLGRYLEIAPHDVDFTVEKNGKPALRAQYPITFNLSHSGDLVVYAIALKQQVGIDVERIKSLPDLEQIAKRVFLPNEIESLQSLQGPDKEQAFYRIWTRGEALLKWSGEGLVEPCVRQRIAERFDGMLQDLSICQGYAAAVATSRPNVQLHIRPWPPIHGCSPCESLS